MTALYLKELRSFLGSIIGYIFMGIFLVANSLFLWVFNGESNIFEGGMAELKPFFVIAPLVLCILVPAITMKMFSEERRTGTIELLFTKPLTDVSIILAKFLAGVSLVVISILPTLIYYWCIHAVGEHTMDGGGSVVDDAATVTSYLGLILLGGCYVAVGVFASTLSSSQIVSFIVSMFLCWFLFIGLDLLANFSQFGNLDLVLRNVGFMEHYQAIQKGVIDLNDVIYFLTVISFFLILALLRLGARKRHTESQIIGTIKNPGIVPKLMAILGVVATYMGTSSDSTLWILVGLFLILSALIMLFAKKAEAKMPGQKSFFSIQSSAFNLQMILVGLVLVNYLMSFTIVRWDLTADKRHSLNPNTIALLEDENRMKDRIYFKVYLDGDLPADFKKMRDAVQDKLDEFILYAGDKIQYEFIDPNGDPDEEFNLEVQRGLYAAGLDYCDIKIRNSQGVEVKTIWPGAIVEYKGQTADRVQFFNRNSIEPGPDSRNLAEQMINNLEYNLISCIRRVTTENKKTVGFLQGHGEYDEWQTMDVRSNLQRYYYVEDVTISGDINALNEIDALVIAGPTSPFTEKDKFVIDQFIMNGGRTLWFIDPVNVNKDSLFYTGQTLGLTQDLNIEKDMLFKYGAGLNTDVILDESCGPIYIPQHELQILPWNFYPLLDRKVHPISKNLDPIKGEYTSSLKITNPDDPDVTKTVLLKSSQNSLIFRAPARINYGLVNTPPNLYNEEAGDYPVALLLEGKFKSPFENRLTDEWLNSPDYDTKFFSDSTKMLVVSDADIIRNEVDSALVNGKVQYKIMPMHMDPYGVPNENGTAAKYIYGNREFCLNAVDYMLEENSLIDIRSKTISQRLLDTEVLAEKKEFWKFLNIVLPLVLVLVLAIAQMVVRRQRYAK